MKAFRNETASKFGYADARPEDVFRAVARARRSSADWASLPAERRASVLLDAASALRRRREELASLILLEVHKNWAEADADVCEAIDFLEYYAREALRIAESGALKPLGVVAVIAPWNFPLAILTGMTSAALVTGNAALMKPAEQAPLIAGVLFDILKECGAPEDVLHLLPGPGETVGAALAASEGVDLVCFTGSKDVGMSIARQRKRVIAEMGGKNAIIVDDSADLDRAVDGTLLSAFGFQGQKCSACSRILLLPGIYDRFKKRFLEAVSEIRCGDPRNPENYMGPMIDQAAAEKCRTYIGIGKSEASLIFQGKVPEDGLYVPPTVFDHVPPTARIAREEIFGPVVCLMTADNLDQALRIANDVPFDLTGGFFSSDPERIQRVKRDFEVGNLYINRKITGALVACQPFGGYRISSLGFKAGGPEYLYQFLTAPLMPEPPSIRHLPSVSREESNVLLYKKENGRLLGKTICERNLAMSPRL